MFHTDDIQHFILGLAVASVFGWQIGTAVNLTLEATQAEVYYSQHHSFEGYWWGDTAQDLIVTEAGVLLGEAVFHRMRHDNRPRFDNCTPLEDLPPGFYVCADDTAIVNLREKP